MTLCRGGNEGKNFFNRSRGNTFSMKQNEGKYFLRPITTVFMGGVAVNFGHSIRQDAH